MMRISGNVVTNDSYSQALREHYGRPNLDAAIVTAARTAGKDPDALSLDDLAPLDQMHIRGMAATLELADLAGLRPGMRVLDVGGGLGGPARTLAQRFGCQVTVLELTEELCQAGEALTRRMGLSTGVSFVPGDALALPFEPFSFDVVWTQHLSMNVPPKRSLYSALRRLIRPGGALALYEVMAGAVAPPRYPLPWAPNATLNSLRNAAWMRGMLTNVGYTEVAWGNADALCVAYFKAQLAATASEPLNPLGPQVLFGAETPRMLLNQTQSLAESRISVIYGIFTA